jgi:hypothetical protein
MALSSCPEATSVAICLKRELALAVSEVIMTPDTAARTARRMTIEMMTSNSANPGLLALDCLRGNARLREAGFSSGRGRSMGTPQYRLQIAKT